MSSQGFRSLFKKLLLSHTEQHTKRMSSSLKHREEYRSTSTANAFSLRLIRF
jgi:hypothetical protein